MKWINEIDRSPYDGDICRVATFSGLIPDEEFFYSEGRYFTNDDAMVDFNEIYDGQIKYWILITGEGLPELPVK